MFVDQCREAAGDDVPRFVSKLDLDVHAVALHERLAQPIEVLVQLLQGAALGADEAGAEHVARSPRIRATRPWVTVISRPQPASQSGQVRNEVRVASSVS